LFLKQIGGFVKREFNSFISRIYIPFMSEPYTQECKRGTDYQKHDSIRWHLVLAQIVGGCLGLLIGWYFFSYLPNEAVEKASQS